MLKRQKDKAVHIRHKTGFFNFQWLRGMMRWEHSQELNNRFKQITIKNINKEFNSMTPSLSVCCADLLSQTCGGDPENKALISSKTISGSILEPLKDKL